MEEQLRHEDITRKIIGCAMKVHTALGNGFQEVIYQRSLEIEMVLGGLGLDGNTKCRFFTEMWK